MAPTEKCGFELYPRLPYSTDLAPNDYFQNLQKHEDEKLTKAIEHWCEGQDTGFGSQWPVVQSIVSLTSSLRGQLVKCFTTL